MSVIRPENFLYLGLAFGLGLLVGLQREWAASRLAGIRTFPLITAFGALCAVFFQHDAGPWVIAAGLATLASVFWMGNRAKISRGEADPGVTTEVAGLVMFLVGALVMAGHAALGVVTAGVVATLLQFKQPLHALVKRIGEDDLRALVRLVIIGMVILPVLPDRAYGPYEVLNPFRIWLMVVLIVGISMAAYVASRLLGQRVGTLLSGILGGLISSTATAVSYARRSTARADDAKLAALVIMIASTVVFARVLIEISIVAPEILRDVGPPLVAMMALMAIVSATAFMRSSSSPAGPATEAPPSELRAAVIFGLLYAGVLLAVAATKQHLGPTALYIVAALSGLTDMDAITLSTAQLVKSGTLETTTGWRLILLGGMTNLVFKAGAVALLGTPRLFVRIAVMFGISLAGGVGLMLFWPW